MARQKMISAANLERIIDLMIEKRVAKLTIPDSVEILMFEPEIKINYPTHDFPDLPGENEKVDEMDLLLHSAT
jgi:hypothetical protein